MRIQHPSAYYDVLSLLSFIAFDFIQFDVHDLCVSNQILRILS